MASIMQPEEPPVGPYSQDGALDDLPAIKYIQYRFLNSDMIESEQFCARVDPNRERLYIAAGYSHIKCLMALMSYEDKDLKGALEHVKHGNNLADQYRAPGPPIISQITGYFWENSNAGVNHIKNMTPLQRHAELIYAETLFCKALLGSVSSGNWLSFLSEMLQFKSMVSVYQRLGKFLEVVDAEAAAYGLGPEDPSIDKDFRSGVELGVGAMNIILSLLPGKVQTVANVFGYSGNREFGLNLLMKTGGWKKGLMEPAVDAEQEGMRRPLADLCLLWFHLIISSLTHYGVDLELAGNIINWNLRRFPRSVFFLFAKGRLEILHAQPQRALELYTQVLEAQAHVRSLHFMAYWELAFAYLAAGDIRASLTQFDLLVKSNLTMSKAAYSYSAAVCRIQLSDEDEDGDAKEQGSAGRILMRIQAAELLERIPSQLQRIAGRSIPLEKFISRKSRKFTAQNNNLLLPALELAYVVTGFEGTPRSTLRGSIIPSIERALNRLTHIEQKKNGNIENVDTRWDDLCLAYLLEGVCWRLVAYPLKGAVISPTDEISPAERDNAAEKALAALELVLELSPKIKLDHYIQYHAHYEIGRLKYHMGNEAEAREHIHLVLSGKSLEEDPKARKGKYSLQSSLILHTQCFLESIN